MSATDPETVSAATDENFDRVEREIAIEATAERVWQLVSEPGWYINDSVITEHRIDRDGDLSTVHDPVHGAFVFRTVKLDEPRYAAFRWLADASDPDSESTLVEFWIADSGPGVILKVVESGFASLSGSEAERRARFDGNAEGWRIELELARTHLTSRSDA
ncbi:MULTISPECIES: ATPase [Gordonia]|uniref:ATPase n=1 Tax=Gordonia TaxID=2053 RepID=UPI0009590F37|nr:MULTISPECIES: ATPase [Gordonia]MDH3013517.1 ATPase [Gordonia alkanivorans]MDH3046381.1 ATPase [Gordonia alkanivorans]MDJ0009331.1 ATPase [Gordonia alkanivorans]MDJ0099230.1 ATPase [Gordonia alkanivorans]MDJ0494906.1 ATPase [Gordonia alkanivorans]